MNIFKLALLGFALLVVLACGGGGGIKSEQLGIYRGTYSAAPNTGDMVMDVRSGGITVTVNDSASGSYTGTGVMDGAGRFALTLTHGSTNLILVGQLTGAGSSGVLGATISGPFNATVSGTYVGPSNQNPFAGTYTGNLAGGGSGALSLTVNSAGKVTGTASDGITSYTLSGTVNNTGVASFLGTPTAGAVTCQFDGFCKFGSGSARTADGDWSSTQPATGTFSAAKP